MNTHNVRGLLGRHTTGPLDCFVGAAFTPPVERRASQQQRVQRHRDEHECEANPLENDDGGTHGEAQLACAFISSYQPYAVH